MFMFLMENSLISPNQSGVKPRDYYYLCTNHFLSLTHKIYTSCNDGFEVRRVILNVSSTFDKFGHQGNYLQN